MDAEMAWDSSITDLPLDPPLPPLHTLSSSSDDDLPQLDLLDLLTFDPEKHQPTTSLPPFPTSPTHSTPSTPPGTTHISLCSTALSTESATILKPKHTDIHPTATSPSSDSQSDIILELSTRLAAASTETAALRKRVASLAVENRQLRGALSDANNRLVAVAKAAATTTPTPNPPVVLGLAQVTADMAKRLGAALVVSDNAASEDRVDRSKKRKRMSGAATAMACFMFMFGAFVATPGFITSDPTNRTDANLPAVWTGDQLSTNAQAVQRVRHSSTRFQHNCVRNLKQLPDRRDGMDDVRDDLDAPCVKTEASETMFVDMRDESAANVVATSERSDPDRVDYSYVLCRDSTSAIANVKSCADRMRTGQKCGMPHSISLIMPAAAAGLDDGLDALSPALAEVQCNVMTVARLPTTPASGSHVVPPNYGRIVATMPEKGFVHRV